LAELQASQPADEQASAEKPATPAKKKHEADDDDSDNEVNEGDDVQDMEAESDGGESDGEKAEAETAKPEDGGADLSQAASDVPAGSAAVASAEDSVITSTPVDRGPCVLLLTALGFGLRFPISHKKLKLVRKGRCPLRVMKVADNDRLVGTCVVSGRIPAKKPDQPKKPWQSFYWDNKEALEVEMQNLSDEKRALIQGEASAEPQEDDAPENAAASFLLSHFARNKFKELSEDAQKVYIDKAETETKAYQEVLEEYQKLNPESDEQLMIGSRMGCISRVMVETVPVIDSVRKGRPLCKPKGQDRISTIAMLSATDVHAEELEAQPAPAAKVARVDATVTARLADETQGPTEEVQEDAEEAPPPPRKATPLKIFPLRRTSVALPNTPPTNKKQATSGAGLAAASLLGTPQGDHVMEASPGIRLRKKMSVSPGSALDIDSVARPSLSGRSPVVSHCVEGNIDSLKVKGRQTGVKKTIAKRPLDPLRLTEPSFDN
jgi:hypothetical protein